MVIWNQSQILIAVIGMIGVASVIPVMMYATSKRNPINRR